MFTAGNEAEMEVEPRDGGPFETKRHRCQPAQDSHGRGPLHTLLLSHEWDLVA